MKGNCPRLAAVSPAWLSAARGEPRPASPAPSGGCRYTACRTPGRSPVAIASSLASKALVRPFSASPVTCTGTLRGRAGVDRHGPGPDRPRSCGLDFDRPRRRGSRRGDPHLEHAVRGLRLHLGGVDALGEREAPLERTVRDLADEVVLARGVVVGLALTLDGE